MSRRIAFGILLALCAAQLGAAVSMIARYETTLRSGRPYRMRAAPVDPADPFRGRYVAVRPLLFRPAPVPDVEKEILGAGRRPLFAVLETGRDGFAQVVRVTPEVPEGGDYLELTSASPRFEHSSGGRPRLEGYDLRVPFDRYYTQESRAPGVEQRYRNAMREAEPPAWLVVRVKGGLGVIEELYVEGVPVGGRR